MGRESATWRWRTVSMTTAAQIPPVRAAETSTLLSGLIPADGPRGVDASGLPTVYAYRDTDFGTPASPVAVTPAVMAELVPAIHVSRNRGASREGTRR